MKARGHTFSQYIRIVNVMILISLLFCKIAWATNGELDNHTTEPETIAISESYGHIADISNGSEPYLVICVRDRHVDPTAQLNISHIINELYSKYGARLVCLEGASRELDTSYYTAFSNDKERDKVAKYFLQQGFFTGVEYFQITNPQLGVTTIGVENHDQYLKHIDSFQENQAGKAIVQTYLDTLEKHTDTLKSHVYSPALKTVDGHIQSYRAGELSVVQLVDNLAPFVKEASISPVDYENLMRYREYLALEKTINFAKADFQREMLIRTLAKNLDKEEADKFMAQTMHFQLRKITPENFYGYLYSLYTYLLYIKRNIDGDAYQDLLAYIDYISVARSIDFSEVTRELDLFLSDLKRHLCETQTQERLVAYSAGLRLLNEFCALKSTHYILDYLDRNPAACDIAAIDAFVSQTMRETMGTEVSSQLTPFITQALNQVRDYYQLAVRRDHTMVDNTITHMADGNHNVAVMVTGGFHTQGITDILRERNIPYVVVSPHPSTDNFDQIYLDRMCGKHLSFENMQSFLSQTLVVPLITSDTAPQERVYYVKQAFAVMMGLEHEMVLIHSADPVWNPFSSDEIQSIMDKVQAALDLYEGLAAQDIMYIVHEVVVDSRMADFKSIDTAGYGDVLDEALDVLELEFGSRGLEVAEILRDLRQQNKINIVRGLPPGINGHAGKQGIYIKGIHVTADNIIHEALAYALEVDHNQVDNIMAQKNIPQNIVINPIPLRNADIVRDFAAGTGTPVVNANDIFMSINNAASLGFEDKVNALVTKVLLSIGRKIERQDLDVAENLLKSMIDNVKPEALAMVTDARLAIYKQMFNIKDVEVRELAHVEFIELQNAAKDLAKQATQKELPLFVQRGIDTLRNSFKTQDVLNALIMLDEYLKQIDTADRLTLGLFANDLIKAMLHRRTESREFDQRVMNLEDALLVRLYDMLIAQEKTPQNVPGWDLNQAYTQNLQMYIDRLKRGEVPEVGVVPDIHGDADGLERLLDYLVLEAGASRLVFLGDLFDRGKQNLKVYEMIKNIKETGSYKGVAVADVQVLFGNHDLFTLLAGLGDFSNFFNWFRNGGDVAIQDFTGLDQSEFTSFDEFHRAVINHPKMKEILSWMKDNMQLYYLDPDHGMLYIHAGIPLDAEGGVDLYYRGLVGMEALQQMQQDLKEVMADPAKGVWAVEYMQQYQALKQKIKAGPLSDQDIQLQKQLEPQGKSPIAIFAAISDSELSPLWVRGGAWFDSLQRLERFKQYLAVIRDELPAQANLEQLDTELASREQELSVEKDRVPFGDVVQRANVEKVMAVVRIMRNLIAMANGQLRPSSQTFVEGIPDYVLMHHFDKQQLEVFASIFIDLSGKKFEHQAVVAMLYSFIPQVITNIDERFDNLYHNLGVNGVVFGHTPGSFAKNIDDNIFGMDLGLVKGFGGALHLGRQGVNLKGFPEKGVRDQMQDLHGGVAVTDRINNLEQRLQRLRPTQPVQSAVAQEPEVDHALDKDELIAAIQERSELLNRLDAFLDRLGTPSQRTAILNNMRLAIDPSGDMLAQLEDMLNNDRLDLSVRNNRLMMANAISLIITRFDTDLEVAVIRDFNREAREIAILKTFFKKVAQTPESEQQEALPISMGQTMDLLRQRETFMRDVLPLINSVESTSVGDLNLEYISKETLLDYAADWIDSLDFTNQDNIQNVALILTMAIQPTYFTGMDGKTMVFDMRPETLNKDIDLLRKFLEKVGQAGEMQQDIIPSVDITAEHFAFEQKKQDVLQDIYSHITPLQAAYIHAIVAAFNGNFDQAVTILSDTPAYDLTPEEALTYIKARQEYNQAENKRSTPFYIARVAIMQQLAAAKLNEVYSRNFRGKDAVMNQLGAIDQIALLQPLADLAKDAPVSNPVRSRYLDNAVRIVMVEDTDGNLDTLKQNLRNAGIINEQDVWIAPEKTRLVQMGVKSQQVHQFMETLRQKAGITGSEVVRLLGRQELFILRENIRLANHPHAQGWNNPIQARADLIQGIIEGHVQAVQEIQGKLYFKGTLRTNIKQQLISEISSAHKIAPSEVNDRIIAEYINELLVHAAKANNFSHPLFQNPRMGGIVIADIGLEAEHLEPLVHAAINNAYRTGNLELYPKKILRKSIYLVGDERLTELAPGQSGHAGIKRNAIYIARGAVSVDGQIDEQLLQKYAAHEAVELQRWQDEAIKLYMGGEYEHLFAAGLLDLGSDGRDHLARDFNRQSEERKMDETIRTMRQYRDQLSKEYAQHLAGWGTMNRKQRAQAWDNLSPWMQRELRKMIRAWSVAYTKQAKELSAKFHEEAQQISPIPPDRELIKDAGQLQDGVAAMPTPMESYPPDALEQEVQSYIVEHGMEAMAQANSEVGRLIVRLSQFGRLQMGNTDAAVEQLERFEDDLIMLIDTAEDHQIEQLKKLVASRKPIVFYATGTQDNELIAVLDRMANILDGDRSMLEGTENMVEEISRVLNRSYSFNLKVFERIDKLISEPSPNEMMTVRLAQMLNTNSPVVSYMTVAQFDRFMEGFLSFLNDRLRYEIYRSGVHNRSSVIILEYFQDVMPLVYNRASSIDRARIREALHELLAHEPKEMIDPWMLKNALKMIRYYSDMLKVFNRGMLVGGVFTDSETLSNTVQMLAEKPASDDVRSLTIDRQGDSLQIEWKVSNDKILIKRDTDENSGSLKAISDEDATPIPLDLIKSWRSRAEQAPLLTIEIAGEPVIAKFIVDADTMPADLYGYHFIDKETHLVIVTRLPLTEEGKITSIAQEVAYHEYREAQWVERLITLFDSKTIEDIERMKNVAHVLAWADQILAFGENGLTPFHAQQAVEIAANPELLIRMLTEDRSYHYDRLAIFLSEDLVEKVKAYDKRFKRQLFELQIGADRAFMIHQFLESINLGDEIDLELRILSLVDSTMNLQEHPSRETLMELVSLQALNQIAVGQDSVLYPALRNLVAGLIRSYQEDMSSAGLLFVAIQNIVINYIDIVPTPEPANFDTLFNDIKLTNESI